MGEMAAGRFCHSSGDSAKAHEVTIENRRMAHATIPMKSSIRVSWQTRMKVPFPYEVLESASKVNPSISHVEIPIEPNPRDNKSEFPAEPFRQTRLDLTSAA